MSDFVYCLNTSTIRPASFRTKIAAAQRAGYSAVELWHDEVDEFIAAGHTLADVRKLLDDAGLKLASMIYLGGWFETTGDVHATALDEVRRRMDQAARLHAEICIAGPPLGRADRELGVKHYSELLAIG
ncbi:MAG TPA: TIM barrel protein, partial [Pirellulales bacterium]